MASGWRMAVASVAGTPASLSWLEPVWSDLRAGLSALAVVRKKQAVLRSPSFLCMAGFTEHLVTHRKG